MKKVILFCFSAILLCSIKANSQEFSFPKTNAKDSLVVKKVMTILAQNVLKSYADTKEKASLDDLFRVQLVAGQYAKIAPVLRELSLEQTKDSLGSGRALGFSFRVYSNVLSQEKKPNFNFESQFEKSFFNIYKHLDEEGIEMVSYYYDKDINNLKNDFYTKLKDSNEKGKITKKEAVALCRSYCSYTTFSRTLPLAKKILDQITLAKYIIEDNVELAMNDGGKISVTVVRKKETTEPLPVVLMYSIYPGNEISTCKEAANKGFVGVVAYVRGKKINTETEPFEHDAKDTYQIIDWISKQPWCNGKVGMYGGSYLGFGQWSAVKYKHPALKTIVPQVAVGAGVDFPMQNGVFMGYMLRWIKFVTNNKSIDLAEMSNNTHWDDVAKTYYQNGLSFRSLDSIDGKTNPIFQRWLNHPNYDKFWKAMTPQDKEFAAIDIPILSTTGYFDDDQTGALYYYKQYQKWNKSNNYYLVIGPYDHFGAQQFPRKKLNDYTIDEVAFIPIQNLIYEWFNYILKDGTKPEFLKDKVNLQVMGANTWIHGNTLQEMKSDYLTFGIAKGNGSIHTLTNETQPKSSILLKVDLTNKSQVLLSGENEYCGFPALLPKELANNKDFIMLRSEPLSKAIITGAPEAHLEFITNKKDFDIAFQLYEELPDGTYAALSNNIARASMTNDISTRKLLEPGVQQKVEMNNNFMACRQLKEGSRLVILLGVNNRADWQVNYGSGKDVSDETVKDARVPLEIEWLPETEFRIPIQR